MNYSMKQWAEDVWRRDDWTCQNCGATTHLDAAHIIPRRRRPDLAHDVNNGVTLCRGCHEFYPQFPKRFELSVATLDRHATS